MKSAAKRALNRYAWTRDRQVIIDVAAKRAEDLYNRFDLVAPYAKRDLDPGLVEFIKDGVTELGDHPFVIRFDLDEPADPATQARIRQSVEGYFKYARELERREERKLYRSSLILMGIGLFLLALYVVASEPSEEALGVVAKFIQQGLMVAAWISIWQGMASFIIHWPLHRQEIKRCTRIATAPVEFGPGNLDFAPVPARQQNPSVSASQQEVTPPPAGQPS